jgi:arsenate reductase-like glutaredoxin family protein
VNVRNLFTERLSSAEVRALAKRAGGVGELVAPTRRDEAAGMNDAALAAWLAEDPRRLRRPIIDTTGKILLGFTASVRRALEAG